MSDLQNRAGLNRDGQERVGASPQVDVQFDRPARRYQPGDRLAVRYRIDDCDGDRKNQPVIGLEIVRGARKVVGKDVWEGGKILDPENGHEYALRLTPIEGGRKLEVRGSFAFNDRTQTWVRVP